MFDDDESELTRPGAPDCPYCGRYPMWWWDDEGWPAGGFWECARCDGVVIP